MGTVRTSYYNYTLFCLYNFYILDREITIVDQLFGATDHQMLRIGIFAQEGIHVEGPHCVGTTHPGSGPTVSQREFQPTAVRGSPSSLGSKRAYCGIIMCDAYRDIRFGARSSGATHVL